MVKQHHADARTQEAVSHQVQQADAQQDRHLAQITTTQITDLEVSFIFKNRDWMYSVKLNIANMR